MKKNNPPKFLRFFEIAYLGIAILFIIEAILAYEESTNRTLIFLALAGAAIFMFFFRRRFRKRNQEK
ncbi:MAG: hypothetical protein ACQESK_00630 [Bacteroidota bacterium]